MAPGQACPHEVLAGRSPGETLGLRRFVRLAKGRWRIEQDYLQLKDELGLDHFEGRSYLGWNHHVTLVSMAYAFLTLEMSGGPKELDRNVSSLSEALPGAPHAALRWGSGAK